MRGITDMDLARFPMRFHPAGDIDRNAPVVIVRLELTEHSGNDRSCNDTQPVGPAINLQGCMRESFQRAVASRWSKARGPEIAEGVSKMQN